MPSVFVMEHDVSEDVVTNLNLYLDSYLKEKKRKSLASTLVGQIQHGQQLLMDHNDEKVSEFTDLLCSLGAEYINQFSKATGATYKTNKRVEMDELWSVHSYERDYNPIHSHGTKTLMGISCTTWTKVPQQILDQPTAGTPPQSFVLQPQVGKLYLFPSWLQHMVYPFQGDGERRTVAANLNCWDMQAA